MLVVPLKPPRSTSIYILEYILYILGFSFTCICRWFHRNHLDLQVYFLYLLVVSTFYVIQRFQQSLYVSGFIYLQIIVVLEFLYILVVLTLYMQRLTAFCIFQRFPLYILVVTVFAKHGVYYFFVYSGGFSLYILEVNLYILVVPVEYYVYRGCLVIYPSGFSTFCTQIPTFFLYILVVYFYIWVVSVFYVSKLYTCISQGSNPFNDITCKIIATSL